MNHLLTQIKTTRHLRLFRTEYPAMHEYDTALKTVLMRLTPGVITQLTGEAEIVRWHNVELPEVRSPRVDMLGETADRRLVHIELQSTNDPHIAFRMLEYALAIRRAHGRFPSQLVLYAGQRPLRMKGRIAETAVQFNVRVFDIRDIDGQALLDSPRLEDNVIAILTRLPDERIAVRRILSRIAQLEQKDRAIALAELTLLAGLRNLGTIIKEETAPMPLLNDIMDHDLYGPKIREGIEQGERRIVRGQIEKRFGPIPEWAQNRLSTMSASDLEAASLRLFDVSDLKQLLG